MPIEMSEKIITEIMKETLTKIINIVKPSDKLISATDYDDIDDIISFYCELLEYEMYKTIHKKSS
jgi:hypothetical protein